MPNDQGAGAGTVAGVRRNPNPRLSWLGSPTAGRCVMSEDVQGAAIAD